MLYPSELYRWVIYMYICQGVQLSKPETVNYENHLNVLENRTHLKYLKLSLKDNLQLLQLRGTRSMLVSYLFISL